MSNADKLIEALDLADDKDFKLKVVEALGELTMCIHWQRGIINDLLFHNCIKLDSKKRKDNIQRLNLSIEEYEGYVHSIAGSRAIIAQLQTYREKGTLHPDFEKLLVHDGQGRVPFTVDGKYDQGMMDIIRRLREVEKHGEKIKSENSA